MAGRLEAVTGCMFSGKTEELLRRVERARIAKREVLVLKPEIDNRYAEEKVVTHYGRSLSCVRLPVDIMWEQLVKKISVSSIHVFAFDEAHFFSPSFPLICEWLVCFGKRVIVSGLDLDFRGEPFGPMPQILALADEVVKLSAVCTICGEPATRSQRIVDGKPVTVGPEVLIGGLEHYEPRCRKHFVFF